MKMSFLLNAFTLLWLLGTANVRANNAEGITAAENLCQTIGYPSQIMECTEVVTQAKYFSKAAVGICQDTMPYPSKKMECVKLIRDRVYSDTSASTCKSMPYPSKVLECLEKTAKPFKEAETIPARPTTGNSGIRNQVTSALQQLEWGNTVEARRMLADLLVQLGAP